MARYKLKNGWCLICICPRLLPKRALRHVLEWYEMHKEELIKNWELCQNDESPQLIEPLE